MKKKLRFFEGFFIPELEWLILWATLVLLQGFLAVTVDVVVEAKNSLCFVSLSGSIRGSPGGASTVALRTEIRQGPCLGLWILEFDGVRILPRQVCRSTNLSLLTVVHFFGGPLVIV